MTRQCVKFIQVRIAISEVRICPKKLFHLLYVRHSQDQTSHHFTRNTDGIHPYSKRYGASIRRQLDCRFNSLFRLTVKENTKILRHRFLWDGTKIWKALPYHDVIICTSLFVALMMPNYWFQKRLRAQSVQYLVDGMMIMIMIMIMMMMMIMIMLRLSSSAAAASLECTIKSDLLFGKWNQTKLNNLRHRRWFTKNLIDLCSVLMYTESENMCHYISSTN